MSIENERLIPLDSRGHRFQSPRDPNFGRVFVVDYVDNRGGTPLRISRECDHLFSCRWCDAYPSLAINAETATARTECPYPDGISSTFTVAFPSGKVIVSDDLRSVYDTSEEQRHAFASYNSSLGEDQVNQAMAALGCAHGPVGNSCPMLLQSGPTSYVIASPDYWETEDDDGPVIPEGWTELAHICTDYWAYCMADFEDWKAKGGHPNPEEMSRDCYVVDMPPGVYQFTNHYGERTFDRDADGMVIFARIELETSSPSDLATPTTT